MVLVWSRLMAPPWAPAGRGKGALAPSGKNKKDPLEGLFPASAQTIRIALALPGTTCTIERSFSTLRRVKTWVRSTMNDDRLSALCVTSVHRDMISGNECFIQRVIDRFAQNPRRIELLFKSTTSYDP